MIATTCGFEKQRGACSCTAIATTLTGPVLAADAERSHQCDARERYLGMVESGMGACKTLQI